MMCACIELMSKPHGHLHVMHANAFANRIHNEYALNAMCACNACA